jgi:hypothetical protein
MNHSFELNAARPRVFTHDFDQAGADVDPTVKRRVDIGRRIVASGVCFDQLIRNQQILKWVVSTSAWSLRSGVCGR